MIWGKLAHKMQRKKITPDSFLTPCIKTNLKQITAVIVKAKVGS